MFYGALVILLDFSVEASHEYVSVQVPETHVVSPAKIGKDLLQPCGTEHRRFKPAVSIFVLNKPFGLVPEQNICRNPAGQEINVDIAWRFPAQITQEKLASAIRFERSELKLLMPDLERKIGLVVVQISQDAFIYILKYAGIGKDELPVNVFNRKHSVLVGKYQGIPKITQNRFFVCHGLFQNILGQAFGDLPDLRDVIDFYQKVHDFTILMKNFTEAWKPGPEKNSR